MLIGSAAFALLRCTGGGGPPAVPGSTSNSGNSLGLAGPDNGFFTGAGPVSDFTAG